MPIIPTMRTVSIFCKGGDMHIAICVSALPGRDKPGPINGSTSCWHDLITDVPEGVSDREVVRRYRQCVLWRTHIAPFAALRPGAIIRGREG